MAYGCAADVIDKYLRLGETTAILCLENFVEGIMTLFGYVYLRRPTPEDLERLLDVGEGRRFPGMIGSIDCMHWEWKNCPTAWKGKYTRGSGTQTIVLEVVASHDLWIWHTFFGPPGTLNGINVLDRSPVFDDILQGRARYLPKNGQFLSNQFQCHKVKISLFTGCQESYRKDVERAFGILQARFAIVRKTTLIWDKVKVGKIMRVCIILHNMIVEDEREGYTHYDPSEFKQREGNRTSQVDFMYSLGMPTNLGNMMGIRNRVRDKKKNHQQLKADLVEHVWKKFGSNED